MNNLQIQYLNIGHIHLMTDGYYILLNIYI